MQIEEGRWRDAMAPLLLSLLPVLTIWAANPREISVREVLFWGALFALGTVLVWAIFVVRTRSALRPSIAVAMVLAWGTAFGHVLPVFVAPSQPTVGVLAAVGAWTCAWLLVGRRLWKARRSTLERMVSAVGMGTAGAFLVAGVSIIRGGALAAGASSVRSHLPEASRAIGKEPHEAGTPLRDIYFVVPDRYAGNRALDSYFGFSNRAFTEFLEARGFQVPERSRANYLRTAHSLAATLNLRYLRPGPGGTEASGSRDYRPLYRLIEENVTVELLSSWGYRYHHLGSWWKGSRRSPRAEYDYMAEEEPECSGLVGILVRTSVVGPVASALGWSACGTLQRHRDRVQRKLALLGEIADDPGPTFTFAHFLVPHEPFVFGQRTGRSISGGERAEDIGWRAAYLDQIRWLNGQMQRAIDRILERSEVMPIIIIQADEGPFAYHGKTAVSYVDWCGAPVDTLAQKFSIFNALLVPGLEDDALSKMASPVNTMRGLFRHAFGMDVPALPSRSFVFPLDDIYEYHDVSEALDAAFRGDSVDTGDVCPGISASQAAEGREYIRTPF